MFTEHNTKHTNTMTYSSNMCLYLYLCLCVEAQSGLKRSLISYNELVVEKQIGEGSYGKVCLGKWNNAAVALKFCRNKGSIEDFAKEIRVMMYGIVIVIDIERY
jgi:hypothetical protein